MNFPLVSHRIVILMAGDLPSYQALEGNEGENFGRIVLSKSMITDHLCTSYMKALESAQQET